MRVLGTLALLVSTVTARGEENPTIYDGEWKAMAVLNPSVQHIPLNEAQRLLRPPPSQIPDSFNMFVGSSVFRDGYRCGKTLFTALKRAIHPERLHFGVLEQIYEGDPTCLEEYCKMAQAEWPDHGACRYKDQIKIDTRSAADSAGCTTARHLQQKLIQNEEFCLQVDGHSIFTNKWDENLLAEWTRIDNEMAVISVYPHHIHDFVAENGDNNIPSTLPHLCTTIKGGNGLTRIVGASMIGGSTFPQLEALWGGGLSFSKCHAERNVPIDPHTPWLWDGEEFLRSADYWTHGYDLYSPSELGSVLYHNYSSKPASFWASPIDPVKKELDTEMAQNRVRLRIGFPFKGNVDTFELEKYGFGEARTFQQYLKFANVSFEGHMNATNSCGQLHWVPYTNATVVEEIVGHGWKQEDPEDGEGNVAEPTLLQQLPPVEQGEVEDEDLKIQRAAQRVVDAHVQTGAGIGEESVEKTMTQLRQKVASPMIQNASNAPAWVFLMVVVSALFVTLSNDSNSRAIRRRCRLDTSHTSIE